MSRVIKSPGDIHLEISCPQRSCPVKGLQQGGNSAKEECGDARWRKEKGFTFPSRGQGSHASGSYSTYVNSDRNVLRAVDWFKLIVICLLGLFQKTTLEIARKRWVIHSTSAAKILSMPLLLPSNEGCRHISSSAALEHWNSKRKK